MFQILISIANTKYETINHNIFQLQRKDQTIFLNLMFNLFSTTLMLLLKTYSKNITNEKYIRIVLKVVLSKFTSLNFFQHNMSILNL